MEHRQDGHAAVQDGLSVGLPDGGLDLFLIGVRVLAPVVPGVFLRDIRLAAGRVRADVRRVPVAAAGCQLVKGIGTGCHRLSLQRLLCKGRRHLRRRDAEQIVLHGHLPDGIALQYPQRPLPVMWRGRRFRLLCLLQSSIRRRRLRRLCHLCRSPHQRQRQKKDSQQRCAGGQQCFS